MLVAAWFGAVSTFLLVIGAGYTVWYARGAFAKQSDELTLLQGQAVDQQETNQKLATAAGLQAEELEASLLQRKHAAEDQKRAQANKVAAWFGWQDIPGRSIADDPGGWGAFIRNASDLPIFDVRVFFNWVNENFDGSWSPANRGGPIERTRVIPPEKTSFVPIPESVQNMHDPGSITEQNFVVSIEFTDVAGHKWERDARGALNAP